MRRLLKILAFAYSVVCYPLLVPTMLMTVYCALFEETARGIFLTSGTFVFTGLIPLVILLYLKFTGDVSDLDVSNPKERTTPYIYTLFSMCLWCTFLFLTHVPAFLSASAVASSVVLLLVTVITPYWKISVHSSCFGGATAMLAAILWYGGISGHVILPLMFVAGGLLMTARIYLNAHTPLQTVTGYLMGFIIVIIPNHWLLMHV